jgi:hypothetical protein
MEHFVEKLDHDRRLSLRHNLRTDMRVRMRKFDVPEQRAQSENLSQRGVFFTTDLPVNKGPSLDLPMEPEGKRGVGVQFDFYEVSRSERPRWTVGAALRGPLAVPVGR